MVEGCKREAQRQARCSRHLGGGVKKRLRNANTPRTTTTNPPSTIANTGSLRMDAAHGLLELYNTASRHLQPSPESEAESPTTCGSASSVEGLRFRFPYSPRTRLQGPLLHYEEVQLLPALHQRRGRPIYPTAFPPNTNSISTSFLPPRSLPLPPLSSTSVFTPDVCFRPYFSRSCCFYPVLSPSHLTPPTTPSFLF